ncbi:MAG TPA: FliG C-terminal domain-containing protein [bacterium]|nr:FliG C-terminal domain-containing protein [bacterium]
MSAAIIDDAISDASSDDAIVPLPASILGSRDGRVEGRRIKRYDFRRPDKFSREQLRTMQNIAESFSRLASTRLSASLRLPCDLSLETVDQLTYDEFMAPLASPCALAIATMEPLRGQVVMHLDAAASDAILERTFGAMPLPTPPANPQPLAIGGLTDIEVSQLERVVTSTLDALGAAWSFVDGIKPRLEQVETEARFCQVVPPREMIVLTSFVLSVGSVKGKLDIAYPFLVLEPIIGMLSARYWFEKRNPVESGPGAVTAWRAPMPAELMLDAGALSIDALRSLRKGAIVPVPDLDRGLGWLRLGGARVAGLVDVRRGDVRRGSAAVTAAFADAGAASKSAVESRQDPMARMAEEVRGGITAINASVSAAMQTMAARIDELKGGQEDLSDRMLFGQSDASLARPAARPFASLAGAPAEALALFLSGERPQVCALILCHVDDGIGARLLSLLPEAVQPEIMRRVASMSGVAPDVLADVERILDVKLSAIDRAGPEAGGIDKAVGMLNMVPREVEKRVITSLDRTDPEMAESIKRSMFVFEDIVLLDDESIRAVFEAADERDIILAMKPVAEELRERLFGRFPEDRRERLRAEFAKLGRMRLAECDAAGFRIVEEIRRLEQEGRIVIMRDR